MKTLSYSLLLAAGVMFAFSSHNGTPEIGSGACGDLKQCGVDDLYGVSALRCAKLTYHCASEVASGDGGPAAN